MKSIIICEGSTDFVLLQYFMRRAHQWEDYRKPDILNNNFKMIRELREFVAELRGTIANLEETVHEFKRKLFGSSSEILPSEEEEAEEDAAQRVPGEERGCDNLP